MARVEIPLPDTFMFKTEMDVYIQHINRGDHLANENLVAFLNEARTRFTRTLDQASLGIDSAAFINSDLAVIYKSEGKHGDTLCIEISAQDFSRYGCDYVYRVSNKTTGQLVAIAKTAMLHYDYDAGKLKEVPADFEALFKATSPAQ